jgi:hypothetical protein
VNAIDDVTGPGIAERRRRRKTGRAALLITVLVFDLWLADSGYGVRRCRHRFEGTPSMRDGVIVCISSTGQKSLRHAGILGLMIANSRGPSYP